MSNYKLIYFNFRGRAEVARLIFAVSGVKYEDFRIDRPTWDEWKAKLDPPFGQVPLLEVDGQIICQSHAIDRYLARKFGLAGKTEWEEARCDMIVDCIEEIVFDLPKIRRQPDPEIKKQIKENHMALVPPALDKLTRILKSNNDGKGFFVGDDLTFADLSFYHYPTHIEAITGGKIDWSRWPELAAFRARVEKIDRIAEWIQKRPVTPL